MFVPLAAEVEEVADTNRRPTIVTARAYLISYSDWDFGWDIVVKEG